MGEDAEASHPSASSDNLAWPTLRTHMITVTGLPSLYLQQVSSQDDSESLQDEPVAG